MEDGRPLVPDRDMLHKIITTMSNSHLEELCLTIPAETDLGRTLRYHLKQWRSDFTQPLLADSKKPLNEAIWEVLNDNDHFRECFWTELQSFLAQRDITDKQLYTAAGILQQTYSVSYSKWAADSSGRRRGAHTKRNNALSICLALKLNILETKDLMAHANYSFSPSKDPRDFIIASCIARGVFDTISINTLLHEAGLESLPVPLKLDKK